MTKTQIFAFLMIVSLSASGAPLSQNDVSILMPLSQNGSGNHLLRPTTNGSYGELLPKTLYDKMPVLAFESHDETYKKLRVVGLRIDPCFPTVPPAIGCQAQIRMVWQPVVERAENIGQPAIKWYSIDAAVHTFYDVPAIEFSTLIRQLENLKDTLGQPSQDQALNVNPLLQKFGLNSPYAQELFSILLAQVGSARLSQATFMQLSGGENIWVFGGFLISKGQTSALPIARVSGVTQSFQNNPIVPSYFQHGGIFPAPQGIDTFNLLVRDSRKISPSDELEVVESTMSTFRVENPNLHNPHTMDCVSCHTAQPAQIWAVRQYPWLMLGARGDLYRFKSKLNLTNTSDNPANTRSLRGFGYFGADPAISQRTINETALVLEKLYP